MINLKRLRLFAFLVLCIVPSILFVIPVPIVGRFSNRTGQWFVALLTYLCLGCFFIGVVLARSHQFRRYRNRFAYLSLVLLGLVSISILKFGFSCFTTFVVLPVFFMSIVTFGIFVLADSSLGGAGVLSFISLLCCVVIGEAVLQRIPSSMLVREVFKTPPLALPDKSDEVYAKNGFRGKRPCRACPNDMIRIVAMGGSSTYGLPMASGAFTYSSYLQRFLDERRPTESFEVLNGGIAGAGIMQIVHSVKNTVLPLKPDIVTVCAWFNDNANAPGWYGVSGKSDRDAYVQLKVLWALQKFPGYQRVHRTRLFGLFRYYVLGGARLLGPHLFANKKVIQPKRMSPEEFEWGLEQIVEMGEENSFLPIFVLEPLNRSLSLEKALTKNQYYHSTLKVAEKFGVPVVRMPDVLHQHSSEWLFFDFIHPNAEGHRQTAESIYEKIFVDQDNDRVNKFFDVHRLDRKLPFLSAQPLYQFESEEIRGKKLTFKASAPLHEGSAEMILELAVNDGILHRFSGLESRERVFEVPAELFQYTQPIVDITLRAVPARDQLYNQRFQVGSTDLVSPVSIDVVSGGKDHGWRVKVEVERKRIDSDWRGYNAVVIGSVSGEVLASRYFDLMGARDNFRKMMSFIYGTGQYQEDGNNPIVVLSVKTDGSINSVPDELAQAFQFLGGSGKIPRPYESFALIGSPGSKPGTALEDLGKKLVEISIGSRKFAIGKLLHVRDVKIS